MKKFAAASLVMILCIVFCGGCGKKKYDAEQSTVFILKKGRIVSVDVENFDVNTYDEAGLKNYIQKAVNSYTQKNGENAVKLDSLTVDGGKAKLTLSYPSAKEYTGFNNLELFTGSMAEALLAGYSFRDARFAEVRKGKVVGEVQPSVFKGNDSYKVVVIKANTRVTVNGTIVYVSSDQVQLESKNTVVIRPGESLLGTQVEPGTESGQKPSGSEVTKPGGGTKPEGTEGSDVSEGTEGSENVTETITGSVGDDELDYGTEETEVVFEFPEETSSEEDTGPTVSEVYTYIIYK